MHRLFLGISTAMAIAGGVVLSALVVMIVLSVIGRELNAALHGDFFQGNMKGFADWLLGLRLPGLWGTGGIRIGPVTGDYELVEAGVAFAIFAFLPLTQITQGHAVVDIFTSWLPERAQRALQLVIEIAFAAVLIIIAVQLWQGTAAKMARGQTTFLLQFPVWWGYAASLVGAVTAAVVSLYVVGARIVELISGRTIITEDAGAGH